VELPDGNSIQFPDINKRDKGEKRQEKTTPEEKSEKRFRVGRKEKNFQKKFVN
jgi:hypothetical protein